MFVPVLSNPKVIAGEPGPLGKERVSRTCDCDTEVLELELLKTTTYFLSLFNYY